MAESGKKTQFQSLSRLFAAQGCTPSNTLDSTLIISSAAAAAAIYWLPSQKDAADKRFPTVKAFVLLIMFGFSTSFSALYSYNRPKLARFLRSASAVFLSSAAVVLLFAVLRASMFKPSA